ncbi:1,4-alpha-glucan branching protein GlgB [Corynebacterium uropygiale]|uniref:1,4-alpha-glucan branching enzyme GlgB n=1 Tax=Corynebacterium uropygiale TaxID=1775911 RepID=A0A9X1QPW5_9CORY|nr:1,4-alpha-glucan branching protein GlgB [Corynebacterium uropygiale]MCF4006971.1 1,4-alpha-glucan branching protein GlgB [Corynebacterium uropygiale]
MSDPAQLHPADYIPAADLDHLRNCSHWAPHDFYGWHSTPEGSVIRTRHIGAEHVELLIDGTGIDMTPVGDDIWIASLERRDSADYRFAITWPGSDTPVITADPYHFLPSLGEQDLYFINEGRHERLWEVLGANPRTYETTMGSVSGTSFAVWAPNAASIALIGDFNGWNPAQHPMRALGSTGVWEIFLPDVHAGARYKFAILTQDGTRKEKADPLAKAAEVPPGTASIVAESTHEWGDSEWMERRPHRDVASEPMSIYEVHLGSWKQGKTYADLATELVDYVAEQGFTHVEFLPVAEHPFGGSWGYQVSGYYAPTARWGSPDELRGLIDAFHQRGIGVIMDWVPGHFPKDDFALARFDGPALYEHPDWRRGEQRDWGTHVFDFGRREVRNFLVANALYWMEEFHIDGIRVDAVASMLYLDYSRNEGEWLPNEYGGRENLEAVQFLQEVNATAHRLYPGILTIAEESTSWPGVTAPTWADGLGFSLKWNMGWMNDTLRYFGLDPIHRSYHHNEITFSMVYAYSERYVLPFSHDEVVHGKGSLWTRMPGDTWNKAAGLRSLYGYMYSHPGKKLLFQGQEFGQISEWSEATSLPFDDAEGWEGEYHAGIQLLVRDLNRLHREEPALHTQDFEPAGFQWLKADDAANNILAYIRWGTDGSAILAVNNFGGTSQPDYILGLPVGGDWDLILNTDAAVYQGAGNDLPGSVHTVDAGWDNQPHSLHLHIPAMSTQYYRLRRA